LLIIKQDGAAAVRDAYLKSTNGGNTWTVQNSGTAKRINWIHFLDQNRGFAVGESGVFLRTDNGGINWNPVVNVTNFSLYHISFIGETGWITGYPGVIYKTTNAGNTWFIIKYHYHIWYL
jgi:photosystem II stability/assembly factor-like uncharacterized protein